MSLAIETERLTLRLRDERDADWYRELVGERGEDTPTLEEATARLARFRDLTIEIGIGALAICRRAEGDAIGYCALIVGRASLDEPEIAYELLRQFHGHGYATEAAQALVDAAAATGRRRLWSTVRPWNTASLRVLEKVGFRRDHIEADERGDIGSRFVRRDYTCIGDAVNRAQRHEAMAPKSGVLMSDTIYARIKEHVVVEEITGIKLKGIEKPVSAYVLKGFVA